MEGIKIWNHNILEPCNITNNMHYIQKHNSGIKITLSQLYTTLHKYTDNRKTLIKNNGSPKTEE